MHYTNGTPLDLLYISAMMAPLSYQKFGHHQQPSQSQSQTSSKATVNHPSYQAHTRFKLTHSNTLTPPNRTNPS
jgi:hypothetical protein